MKLLLSIKTLLRTPIKTFLTFIILALVSFALFSQIAQYSITNREINNAAKEYRGIGSGEITPASDLPPMTPFLINEDPRMVHRYEDYMRYQPLSESQINTILKLPYISSSSTRYMTSGVSDKYLRMDEGEDYYNYTARFIIEGTLTNIQYGKDPGYDNVPYFNYLSLDNCTLLAGDPSCLTENNKIRLRAYPENSQWGLGHARAVSLYNSDYKYDTQYIKNLNIGDRYIFVGRYDLIVDPVPFCLGDQLTDSWCESVQSIEGLPENYLETEEFTPLRELIEMTNSDLHTFDVVYTDNMSAIMRFAQGNMAITTGRELTMEDSNNKSKICVISSDFATENELKIGDKITLKLGTELFEQNKSTGAVAAAPERYTPAEKQEELEIVGIYTDTDGKNSQIKKINWSYSMNTVFVPKTLLPIDESQLKDHEFAPGEFSFIVEDPWNISAFKENMEEECESLKEKGINLIFYDDGWPQIEEQFKQTKKLSAITIIAVTGAVIAATGFIILLFIGRKKKEYGIMRALGTTKNQAAKSLMIPLMVLTIIAVLTGSIGAWIYTIKTVAQNDTLIIIKDYTINTSVPITTVLGCMLGQTLLVLIISKMTLRRMGKIQPLTLLQEKQTENKKQKQRKTPSKDIHTKNYENVPESPNTINTQIGENPHYQEPNIKVHIQETEKKEPSIKTNNEAHKKIQKKIHTIHTNDGTAPGNPRTICPNETILR